MRILAYLAIAIFCTISVLVSLHREWFGFIYDLPGRDKLFHFIGMGLLSFFMVLGFPSWATKYRIPGPLASMAAAAVLVTLEEVIQIAIPSRVFSLDDLAWSFAGVLVFGLAAAAIGRIGFPNGSK